MKEVNTEKTIITPETKIFTELSPEELLKIREYLVAHPRKQGFQLLLPTSTYQLLDEKISNLSNPLLSRNLYENMLLIDIFEKIDACSGEIELPYTKEELQELKEILSMTKEEELQKKMNTVKRYLTINDLTKFSIHRNIILHYLYDEAVSLKLQQNINSMVQGSGLYHTKLYLRTKNPRTYQTPSGYTLKQIHDY